MNLKIFFVEEGMDHESWCLGIDIGATKVLIAKVLLNGQVSQQFIVETYRTDTFEAGFEQISSHIDSCLETSKYPPEAIGIGIAGQLAHDNSFLTIAPNLNWSNIPLQQIASERFRMPVHVINDVRAATWCEWKLGAGRDVSDLVCIMIGTGIGGGVISQGTLLTGFAGAAGELGHFPIDLHGPMCSCGHRGCFETVASGWAVASKAKAALREDAARGLHLMSLVGGNIDKVTAKEVLTAAHQGDELSQTIMQFAEQAIISACIGYANVFNPAVILIGGGLGWAMPNLCEHIQGGICRYSMGANRDGVKVQATAFKDSIVAVGAACYARDRQKVGF